MSQGNTVVTLSVKVTKDEELSTRCVHFINDLYYRTVLCGCLRLRLDSVISRRILSETIASHPLHASEVGPLSAPE